MSFLSIANALKAELTKVRATRVAAEDHLSVAADATAAARAQLKLAEEREAGVRRKVDMAANMTAWIEKQYESTLREWKAWVEQPPVLDKTVQLPDDVMTVILELVQRRIASDDQGGSSNCKFSPHGVAGSKTLLIAVPAVSAMQCPTQPAAHVYIQHAPGGRLRTNTLVSQNTRPHLIPAF